MNIEASTQKFSLLVSWTLTILYVGLLSSPVTHAEPDPKGACVEQTRLNQPTWSDIDLNYVCTARNMIALDSVPHYTGCVIPSSFLYNDKDFIINECLKEYYAHGRVPHCVGLLLRERPEFNKAELKYVCTARGRIAEDSIQSYTMCVTQSGSKTKNGELIINRCLSGKPMTQGSCFERIQKVRSEWSEPITHSVCTARGMKTEDSDLIYDDCVVNFATHSDDHEGAINKCQSSS